MNKIEGNWWCINNKENEVEGALFINDDNIKLKLDGLLNIGMPFDLEEEEIILGKSSNNELITLYLCNPTSIEISLSGISASEYNVHKILYGKHYYMKDDILNILK